MRNVLLFCFYTALLGSCNHIPQETLIDKSSYEPAIEEDFNLNQWWDAEYNLIDKGLSKELFPKEAAFKIHNYDSDFYPKYEVREEIYKNATDALGGKFYFTRMIGFTGLVIDSFWRTDTDHPTIRARQYFSSSAGDYQYGARQKCWFGEYVNEWTVEECPTRSEAQKQNGLKE